MLTWSSFFLFFAGFVTPFRIDAVGAIYVGEVVLVAIALWAVLTQAGQPRFWEGAFVWPLFLLCLTLFGYVLSDLVNGTLLVNSLRGAARMLFLITDFIALKYLCPRKPVNLLVFCLGFGLGLVACPTNETLFTSDYKLRLALPLTLLVVCAGPLLRTPRRFVWMSTGLVAIGVLHFFMDFRSLGAICVVAGAILFSKTSEKTRLRSCYLVLLILTMIGGATTLYWSLNSSEAKYAARRSESNSLRIADYEAIAMIASQSPVVGAGSWATNSEVVAVMNGRLAGGDGRRLRTAEISELPGHSQLLQVWYEAGILGLSFFLFFAWKLFRTIWSCVFNAQLSPLFPLALVYSMFSLWHVLFSPFAGSHRIHIAISAVILVLLSHIHRSGGNRASARMVTVSGTMPVGFGNLARHEA